MERSEEAGLQLGEGARNGKWDSFVRAGCSGLHRSEDRRTVFAFYLTGEVNPLRSAIPLCACAMTKGMIIIVTVD